VERVKAILRRANPKEAASQKESEARILERGLLRMDPERHTCTWKDEPVTLTVTEEAAHFILSCVADRPYKQVAPLFNELQAQVQVQANTQGADTAAADNAEVSAELSVSNASKDAPAAAAA
jgi:hypothetical protein